MRHSSTLVGAVALAVSSLVLAGCGNSQKKVAEPPPFRGIYTTSGDCSDSGKFTLDDCLKAMETAVTEHEKSAPTYSSLKSCEATEGADRCERTHVGNYRPVLLAFLMIASKPPAAKPLYGVAADSKTPGFRATNKDTFNVGDEQVQISRHAQSLAEMSLSKKKAPPKKMF